MGSRYIMTYLNLKKERKIKIYYIIIKRILVTYNINKIKLNKTLIMLHKYSKYD